MKKIHQFYWVLFFICLSQTAFSQQLKSFYDIGKTGKYGFKNIQGTIVIPPKYDFAYDFKEGMAAVSIGGKSMYDDFYETYTYNKGKWGFINKEGQEIVPLKYDEVSDFSEGLAVVGLNNKFGFINKQGLVIIPLKYSTAAIFEKGKASVSEGGAYYFIDKAGNRITEKSSNNTGNNLSQDIDKIYQNTSGRKDSANPYNEKKASALSSHVLQGQDEYRKKNYAAAFKIFEAAAGNGDTEAMVRLGAMYYDGIGTKKNLQLAYDWYLKAASNNNSYAANELGVMYTNGTVAT